RLRAQTGRGVSRGLPCLLSRVSRGGACPLAARVLQPDRESPKQGRRLKRRRGGQSQTGGSAVAADPSRLDFGPRQILRLPVRPSEAPRELSGLSRGKQPTRSDEEARACLRLHVRVRARRYRRRSFLLQPSTN